ncbi:unnamed protein product, partial [Closterium sp. NIES-54]
SPTYTPIIVLPILFPPFSPLISPYLLRLLLLPPPTCTFPPPLPHPLPSLLPTSAIAKAQLQTPENATILRLAIPWNSVFKAEGSIYPQKVAADGDYDYRHGGTMYFGWAGMAPTPGAPNETVLVANYTTVGAFAITGTSALGTPEAESMVEPHCAAVNTPPYFVPMSVEQKKGPVPTAWAMNSTIAPIGPSLVDARGVVVNPGKRHMWVSFMSAFGKEMSASAVVARLRLSLRPNRKWRTLRVFLERFKVVGVGGGNSLIQGTIALNRHGKGIIAASLAGRSFYPSAAYATLNANVDVGRVNVVAPGKAPLDDYSGYLGAPEMRYGDYMSATVDEEGNAWAAVQGGRGTGGTGGMVRMGVMGTGGMGITVGMGMMGGMGRMGRIKRTVGKGIMKEKGDDGEEGERGGCEQ